MPSPWIPRDAFTSPVPSRPSAVSRAVDSPDCWRTEPDTSFAPTNVLGVGKITALPDGVSYRDNSGFYRFADTGQQDRSYAWSSRLEVWDLDPAGNLVGVLPGTTGDGVIRRADGTPALPASTLKVPVSFNGYSFIRVGPDGSLWLAMGDGVPEPPSTKLYRLNGLVTPLALLTSPESQTVNAGARVTLVSGAAGTSKVTYQWQRDGAPLAGQTNAHLVFENVRPQDSGDYTVVVSNRSGFMTSRPATLIVSMLLPKSCDFPAAVVVLGDTLLLSVGARGIAPLTHQWRRTGSPWPWCPPTTPIARWLWRMPGPTTWWFPTPAAPSPARPSPLPWSCGLGRSSIVSLLSPVRHGTQPPAERRFPGR